MENSSKLEFTVDANDGQNAQCTDKITGAEPILIDKVRTVIRQRLKRSLNTHFRHRSFAITSNNPETIRVGPIEWFFVPFNKGEWEMKSDVPYALLYIEQFDRWQTGITVEAVRI